MRIETQRFGNITLDQDQLFLFPSGLIGMETLRDWALLPDPENSAVAWLQNASRGDRALPLISPRAFFPDYRVQVSRRELACLHIRPGADVFVLTTVSGHSGKLTTNLRSPILLNLSRRLGCQVITDNDYPLQQTVSSLHSDSVLLPPAIEPSPVKEAVATKMPLVAAASLAAASPVAASLVQKIRRAA